MVNDAKQSKDINVFIPSRKEYKKLVSTPAVLRFRDQEELNFEDIAVTIYNNMYKTKYDIRELIK